jgi:hypothetical protein
MLPPAESFVTVVFRRAFVVAFFRMDPGAS